MSSKFFWIGVFLGASVLFWLGLSHFGPPSASVAQDAGPAQVATEVGNSLGAAKTKTQAAPTVERPDPFADPPATKPTAAGDGDPFAAPAPKNKSTSKKKPAVGGAVEAKPAHPKTTQPQPTQAKPARAKPVSEVQPPVGEAAIEKALANPAKLEFTDAPLSDVVDFLKDFHKILIVFDKRAMEDVGVGTDVRMTINVQGISLRSALDLLLREHNLTWTIRSQVLLITTPEEAANVLKVRLYEVGDLIAVRDEKDQPWDDYDTLVHAITTTLAPQTWEEVGGPGSICGATFGNAKVLIVGQTYAMHDEVRGLLEQIREIADKTPKSDKPPLRPRPKPAKVHSGMGMGGMGGTGMGGGVMGGMPPGVPSAEAPKDPAKPQGQGQF